MPAITVSDEVFSATPDPFTVQLEGKGICPAHFKNGQVYLGDHQLTVVQQKKFIELFSQAYRGVRHRNYGWHFLSSCHTYFNGQLQEIQNQKTEAAKIRYLFCHAERTPDSKTTEVLLAILPVFYGELCRIQPATVIEPYVRKKTTHFISEPAYQTVQKIPETALIARSFSYDRHLQWMEAVFKGLWEFTSIIKTASIHYDVKYSKYYLFFYDDCRAAIMKSNLSIFAQYSPFEHTIECETAEAEWGKKLYLSFNYFRHHLNKSNGCVNEIHSAFNELIEQVHLDPPNLDSAYLKNGEFHDAVINLRLQLIVIHIDWRKSVFKGEAVCDLRH